MPSIGSVLQAFETLLRDDPTLGRRLVSDLLDRDGRVRFKSLVAFHDHVFRCYGFVLRRNTTDGVRAGGRHLFYIRGNLTADGFLLMRVKTSGTAMHHAPHMTVSMAIGLSWDEELAKLNRQGQFVPKQGAVPRASKAGDWRSLTQLGGTTEAILASDDQWAEACHFDFVRGLDAGSAPNLQVVPF